ncbi:MAG: TadE/TadG family type IV pilus assembly protein [Terriglobales bacterium]
MAELALVLPLLLFLGLAVSEGSRFIRVHQVLNNAAREGARLSSLPENFQGVASVKNAVVAYAAANTVTITAAEVNINQCATITTAAGIMKWASVVTVTHVHSLRYLPRVPFSRVSPTITLRGNAEFVDFYGC